MPIIELTTSIQAPIRVCFDLARSIDVHKLSTGRTHEEAIAGTTSGLIGRDEQVTWRAKHFGITQTLTSKITAFQYPIFFRDEMLYGVFKMIRHDHIFEEAIDGTVMKDNFEFQSPGGAIGKIFNHLVLTDYLKRLLAKRNQMIKEIAESEQWKYLLKP
jgi:ligand-binding SRPBCC domain-containing protein